MNISLSRENVENGLATVINIIDYWPAHANRILPNKKALVGAFFIYVLIGFWTLPYKHGSEKSVFDFQQIKDYFFVFVNIGDVLRFV